MVQEISKQIDNVDKALAWIKINKADDYQVKFLDLVEQRRRLKMVKRAASDNPAIAAFGKSQVGKSYLMSCILQNKGKAFKVCTNGNEYDFIKEINPIGDSKEATGVVTRFSSFKRQTGLYDTSYPVLIKCLSLIDIIIILSDTYYNDISNYTTPSESELMEECNRLKDKYSIQPEIINPIITADDILEMKRYFKKHINHAQVFNNTSFFSELALLIEKIPVEDYVSVFRLLWHSKESEKNGEHLSRIFRMLLHVFKCIGFAEYIYLPIDAVLHEGIKENTVMSVQCLKRLLNTDDNSCQTDVFVKEDGKMIKVGTFSKSEICAIASEAVFRISKEFITSKNKYCLDDIGNIVKSQITQGDIEMSILDDNDLLDFPGARSRLSQLCEKLIEKDNVLECYLRGKVAYLFNKYNESLSINVLLYCHNHEQNDVTDLWHLLNEWVETYVGNSTEKRRKTLERTKISPLFYIATMFNLDMKSRGGVEDSRNAINDRWCGRFETVLLQQCFKWGTVDWVKEWTAKGHFFNNSYLLRDYKYSGEENSRLYEGFSNNNKEEQMMISRDYYEILRETFVNNSFVHDLFENPEKSWDLATTINNDGSLYIIEQLSIVASRMWKAREDQFMDILQDVTRCVNDVIKDYYISTDVNELLDTNIRKVKSVLRELSFTCNSDNYYFGHLIQALQITEAKCYKIIHKIMQDPNSLGKANEFKNYEIILKDCELNGYPLDECNNKEEKWNAIIQTYGFVNQEDALDYLHSKQVDPDILFEEYLKMLNSNIIANEIYESWCNGIKSVDFMNSFTGDDSFSSIVMNGLIENIIATSKRVGLCNAMAHDIAEFVDVTDVHSANESLLADILADAINGFILDLGFSTLSESSVQSVKELTEKRHLPIFKYIGQPALTPSNEELLTTLFDDLSANPQALIPSFENHYYQWIEYLYISYIAHLEVPTFDPAVNEELKMIIDNLQSVKC